MITVIIVIAAIIINIIIFHHNENRGKNNNNKTKLSRDMKVSLNPVISSVTSSHRHSVTASLQRHMPVTASYVHPRDMLNAE